MFPEFANVADELAVEWQIALDELNDLSMISITDEQWSAIKKLDTYMLSISGSVNIQYWNNDALCQSAEWQKMREMAIDILSIMQWEKLYLKSLRQSISIMDNGVSCLKKEFYLLFLDLHTKPNNLIILLDCIDNRLSGIKFKFF